MKTFSEFISINMLSEKTKIVGGSGYSESFINDPKAFKAVENLVGEVNKFIKASEEFAKEEDVSIIEQKELIIDDIIAHIYKELDGK